MYGRMLGRMVELFLPWLLRSCLLSFQALHSVVCSALSCRHRSPSLARLICGSFLGVGLRGPRASSSDGLWRETVRLRAVLGVKCLDWSDYQPG